MASPWEDGSEGYELKPFWSPEQPEMKWAVTGPVRNSHTRWCKLFLAREEAEEFLRKMRAGAGNGLERPQPPFASHRRGFFSFTYRAWLPGLVLILGLAFFIDRSIHARMKPIDPDFPASTDFETNPILLGWTAEVRGTDWSMAEHRSGWRSILVEDGSWVSPAITVPAGGRCRVRFYSKSRAATRPDAVGGRCQAEFVDSEDREICRMIFQGVHRSSSWESNQFCVLAPSFGSPAGNRDGLKIRLRFLGEEGQALFIDDFAVEKVSAEAVAQPNTTLPQAAVPHNF